MKKIFTCIAVLVLSIGLFAQNTHEYVDLGLPSGLKWATMNVGADSVRGLGAFFAYGDVTPDYAVPGQKSGYARSFDWANYKWSNESGDLTKYCTNDLFGTVDNLKFLLPEDDAATVVWGSEWRTPTQHEYLELLANCTHDTVWENGVFGLRLTSRVPGYEGRSIFFPYSGIREKDIWKGYEEQVVSAYMIADHEDKFGNYFSFPDAQGIFLHIIWRYIGANVRAVYKEKSCAFVDLGLNKLWAAANINATTIDDRGDYFAWGSIAKQTSISWDTYPFGTEDNLTKYNTKSECGTVDNKTELEDADEVAKALCGNGWHMPDTTDWQELVEKCEWVWVDTLAVPGYMVTSKVPGYEGARMYLPAVGFKEDIYINQPNTDFYYYTSHLDKNNPNKAISVYFSNITGLTIESDFRYYGFACRPVKDKPSTGEAQVSARVKANKYMHNGHLFIRKGNRIYTILGLEK